VREAPGWRAQRRDLDPAKLVLNDLAPDQGEDGVFARGVVGRPRARERPHVFFGHGRHVRAREIDDLGCLGEKLPLPEARAQVLGDLLGKLRLRGERAPRLGALAVGGCFVGTRDQRDQVCA
jgi:hypothetical protein